MRVLRLGKSPSANGVGEAIAREELAGLAYMFWARVIAIAILAGWALTLPFERSGFYLLTLAAFALLGALPYLLARRGIGGLPVSAAFLLLDAGLLSYILIVPPPQLSLRLWNFRNPPAGTAAKSVDRGGPEAWHRMHGDRRGQGRRCRSGVATPDAP
jgi:hypothetical protein